MLKLLLSVLLFAGSFAHAAASDVNVTNPYIPVQQYGIWGVSINNLPSSFGATQNGNWNVGQYGNWYVGQYGTWSVNVAGGSLSMTASASGLTITPAGGSMTVTVKAGSSISVTAAYALPVSIVAGVSGLAGSVLQVTATSTVSTNSGTNTAQAAFAFNMGYDAGTSTWRRQYLGSAGDNTGSILFPGTIGYGVYNATGVTLTTGNVARTQVDSHGRLLTRDEAADVFLSTIQQSVTGSAKGVLTDPVYTRAVVSNLDVTGTVAALNSSLVFSTPGIGTLIMSVSGTWTGTINAQGSNDGFVDPGNIVTLSTFDLNNGSQEGTNIISPSTYFINPAGFKQIKIKMVMYTSGSAQLLISGSIAARMPSVISMNADNFHATIVGDASIDENDGGSKPIKVAGMANDDPPTRVSNNTRQNQWVDTRGRVVVRLDSTDSMRITGSASLTDTTETIIIPAQSLLAVSLDTLVITTNDSVGGTVVLRDSYGSGAYMNIDYAPYGGAVLSLSHILPQALTNTSWSMQLTSSPTSGKHVSVFMAGSEN